jgi:hypothetical protein
MCFFEQLKNVFCGGWKWRGIVGAGISRRIDVAKVGAAQSKDAVGLCAVHDRREPSVRGGKLRGHKIIVGYIGFSVEAHGPLALDISESFECGKPSRGLGKAIQGSGCGGWVFQIEVPVTLIPERAQQFHAFIMQVETSNGAAATTGRVGDARGATSTSAGRPNDCL